MDLGIAISLLSMVIALGAFLYLVFGGVTKALRVDIASLKTDLSAQKTDLSAQIGRVETNLDHRMDQLTERINQVDTSLTERINQVDTNSNQNLARVDNTLTARLDRVEGSLQRVEADLTDLRLDTKALETRVFYLATNQKQPPLESDDLTANQMPARNKIPSGR